MKHIRHSAAVAVASGVAVASLALPLTAAQGASAATTTLKTSSPAAAAAGFLASRLEGKHADHYDGSFSDGKGGTTLYVNYGETADAILSMDAAGVSQTAAARATRYLEANVGAYAGTSVDNYSPGGIGKLLLVAEAQKVDVHDFGGVDLVKAVASTEGVRGASAGEYQQNASGTPADFDYTSTVSQSLPVLALADAPSASGQPSTAAVTFLADQQCSDGGYPTEIESDPATACAAGEDVDSTAYAVQALIAANSHDAAAKGLAFLTSHELSNGGFGDAKTANANSTAIAIEALVAGRQSVAKAETWLLTQQIGCAGAVKRRGAVTYQGSYDGSTLLATSQAGAALARAPLAWVSNSGAHLARAVLSCPTH